MEITTILWMFMLGGAIAIISVYYNNRFLGNMVRALIAINATSPETAISAEELGVKITPALSHAFRKNEVFSKTVIKTDDDKYYIAPDKVSMAKSKYGNKDTSIIFVILSIVILFVVTLALTVILPDVVKSFSDVVNEVLA